MYPWRYVISLFGIHENNIDNGRSHKNSCRKKFRNSKVTKSLEMTMEFALIYMVVILRLLMKIPMKKSMFVLSSLVKMEGVHVFEK